MTLQECINKGDLIGGCYRLDRELGRGGMGTVWRGRHELLNRPVAVKLMHPSQRSAFERSRFEREARILGRLRSRHLPMVTDGGIVEQQPFMVMELLEGEDLAATLQREGQLSLERLKQLVRHIAKGLEVIHAAGIVHRDLKPSNIFLHDEAGEEVAKIIDFGVARVLGEDDVFGPRDVPTTNGALVGSPRFMSPEQIHGVWERVDHRADLWSLAVIVYRCLSGVLPFPGDSFPSLVLAICGDEPPPLDWASPALRTFFARALAKDPEDRFASASELSEAFASATSAASSGFPRALGWRGADDCPTVRLRAAAWS